MSDRLTLIARGFLKKHGLLTELVSISSNSPEVKSCGDHEMYVTVAQLRELLAAVIDTEGGREIARLRRIATRMRDALEAARDAIAGKIDTVDGDPPTGNWASDLTVTIDTALGEAWPCGPKDAL